VVPQINLPGGEIFTSFTDWRFDATKGGPYNDLHLDLIQSAKYSTPRFGMSQVPMKRLYNKEAFEALPNESSVDRACGDSPSER